MMAAQAGACTMVPIHREHQPHTPEHSTLLANTDTIGRSDVMKDVAYRRNSQRITLLAMKPANRNKRKLAGYEKSWSFLAMP